MLILQTAISCGCRCEALWCGTTWAEYFLLGAGGYGAGLGLPLFEWAGLGFRPWFSSLATFCGFGAYRAWVMVVLGW